MKQNALAAVRVNNTARVYRCEPGWRWASPPLPDHDLWYVLAGAGEMALAAHRLELRPGDCFVLPPGSQPRATQDPAHRLHVFAVHFDPLGPEEEPAPALPPLHLCVHDRPLFDALARRCAECAARERGDELASRQVRLLILQMLLHLYDQASRPVEDPADARVREVAAAIRDTPGAEWPVPVQAARACLSPSQYTRRFTRRFGVAPARYVIEARLERAEQLLRETDMTVGAVAEALGYRDLFFFSRQFKARRGVPPTALRAGLRPEGSEKAAEKQTA